MKKVGSQIEARRQVVFLTLAGIFIGCMSMLNILGITKFVQLGPFSVAVGVLPYPLTFLCTDLLSEFYGRRRTTAVVWVGLLVNILLIFFVWLGELLPSVAVELMPPWQSITLAQDVTLPNRTTLSGDVSLFSIIYGTTIGAVFASLIAYLAAQFCDVFLFHFLKKKSNGKYLWLRNNGSTLVSQGIDSIAVIFITFGAVYLADGMTLRQLLMLVASNYGFKFCAALVDTPIIYACVYYLKSYLQIDPRQVQPD